MPLPSATKATQKHAEDHTEETTDEQPDISMMLEIFITISIAPIFLIIITSTLAVMEKQISIYYTLGIPILSMTALSSTIFLINHKSDYEFNEEDNTEIQSAVLGMTLLVFFAVIVLLDHTFLTEITSVIGTQTVNAIRELYILTFLAVSLPTGFLLGRVNQKNPYITSILTTLVSIILIQLLFML